MEGVEVASAVAKVYGESEVILEGLPVQWAFKDAKGTSNDKTALKAAKPEWEGNEHYVKSDNQNGAASITAVEAAGKTAEAMNSWGYNDEVCPPTSMYAAYNSIQAPKELHPYLETGHFWYQEQYDAWNEWIWKQLGL